MNDADYRFESAVFDTPLSDRELSVDVSGRQAPTVVAETDRRWADVHRAGQIFYGLQVHPHVTLDYLSPSIQHVLGYSLADVSADRAWLARIVHPDDRARLESALHEPDRLPFEPGFRWIHKDGRVVSTEHVVVLVRDRMGRVVAIEGLVRDVTAASPDAASPIDFRALAEEIPAVVYLAEPGGAIRFVTTRVEPLTGFNALEWTRQPRLWFDRIHPDDRARMLSLVSAETAGHPWQADYRLLARDGRVVWVRQGSAPIHDARGEVLCVQGLVLDITPSKQVSVALGDAQRMESIARLAGVVAHDFNNLLTVILGHSEMLLDTLHDEAGGRGDALEIKTAAEAAARVTAQLLAISQRQSLAPRAIDLNDLVRDSSEMLHQLAGPINDLRVDLDSDLPMVTADPHQLERVLRGLVVNARDAMPRGGRITVSTRPSRNPARREVCLSVSDTAGGLPDELRERIFDPFFARKGAGLDRAAIYGIVIQSGGAIRVDDAPGQGTTYVITLPAFVG